MSFCSKITGAAITNLTQAKETYTLTVLPQSSSYARIQSGPNVDRLTNESLESIYNSLKASGKLVAHQNNLSRLGDSGQTNLRNENRNYTNLNTVGQTELQTIRSISQEYCFYYIRYKYVLEALFDKLVSTSAQVEASQQDKQTINEHLNLAININSKLNDIIQITNYLANKRASEMQGQNSEINQLNTSISATYENLKKHNAMLKKETSIADLRKSMVEYSQEKNLSAQNLLALYGFLNLVAIGLLFYISRS